MECALTQHASVRNSEAWCRHRNLSQQELAERSGPDRQAIGTVESGQKAAKIDSPIVIAKTLDIPSPS
ncbi:helix-turn-helix transcriptional regulator [Streptomyces hygroscopicus]|uniref:helix-turn-helix transcriptional regulator n=1 Tax=Streptomyces hygroscopicus TaxID=1912 RepID=UPI000767A6B8|nr:hypothetical protein Shyhy02_62610 [Streptomyces hygroscopicus subsp. hygroscopicus]